MFRYYTKDFWKSIILYHIINNGIRLCRSWGKKAIVGQIFIACASVSRLQFSKSTKNYQYCLERIQLVKCSIWSDVFERYTYRYYKNSCQVVVGAGKFSYTPYYIYGITDVFVKWCLEGTILSRGHIIVSCIRPDVTHQALGPPCKYDGQYATNFSAISDRNDGKG